MGEQKYYTPAPEDLRIGLQCEMHYPEGLDVFPPGWYRTTMNNLDLAKAVVSPHKFRVPYLTAEQIEAEGWEVDDEFPAHDGQILPYILNFENDHTTWYYHLWHNLDDSGMEITRYQGNDMQTVFHGHCRCINEFRTIVRLCNII